jgi:hypothetical protein
MASPEMKRKLTLLGVFALPVVLVKGFAFMTGGPAPVTADAALQPTVGPARPVLTDGASAVTEEQLHAARYVAMLEGMPFGASPLFYAADEEGEPVIDDDQISDVAPEYLVQAIMSSGGGRTTALIDGVAHRVGDELFESGWFIRAIDAEKRSITIELGESGRTAERVVLTDG